MKLYRGFIAFTDFQVNIDNPTRIGDSCLTRATLWGDLNRICYIVGDFALWDASLVNHIKMSGKKLKMTYLIKRGVSPLWFLDMYVQILEMSNA